MILQSENSHTVRLSFNTPNSRIDRELTTEFILRRPQRQVQLNIKTPWKKINIDGNCVMNDDLKRATLGMLLDDRQRYSITTELQVSPRFQTINYLSSIPNHSINHLSCRWDRQRFYVQNRFPSTYLFIS